MFSLTKRNYVETRLFVHEFVKTYPPFDEKFSIIIPSHQGRFQQLKEQMDLIAYGQSKYLDRIFIYWVDRKNPMPNIDTLIDNKREHVEVFILESPTKSTIDRFLIPEKLRTETIFSMDDDLHYKGENADFVFEIYINNHFQNRVYGGLARACRNGEYVQVPGPEYNIALTGVSLLNVKMLETINKPEYSKLRNFVTEHMNCEDLLMNYVVSHNFHAPPVFGKMPSYTLSLQGLSNRPNHTLIRSECCRLFDDFFGYHVTEKYSSKRYQPLDRGLHYY